MWFPASMVPIHGRVSRGLPNFFPVLRSKCNPPLGPSRQKDFLGFTEALERNLHEDPGMTLKERTSQVGEESLIH